MKVLEIGPNTFPQAHLLWEGEEIDYLEADESAPKAKGFEDKVWYYGDARFLPDVIGEKNTYDIIFASHVLEHIPWWDLDRTLKTWVDCLNPGGSLHVVVPSLEWAAKQILSENPSKALLPHLYSDMTTPWNIHVSGFTMRFLRVKLEKAGLAVAMARTGDYTLYVMDEPYEAEQHYAAGFKLDGLEPVPRKD